MAHNASPVFQYDDNFQVTAEVKEAFDNDGYIVVKNLLNEEEATKLLSALENDKGIHENTYGRADDKGWKTKVALWNHPGDDVTGRVARAEKVAGTFEKLLGGELYHYHSKLIIKEAGSGGAHLWHQDYGYWYEYGCLYPNMGTVWMALDEVTLENSCLQVLAGSHKVGRITHRMADGQMVADSIRIEHLKTKCPERMVQVSPGDAILFHCNLLHCSKQNQSARRRWAFLIAYNRADNDPVIKTHHPNYTKLHKIPDTEILTETSSTKTDIDGRDFYFPKNDDPISKHQKKETTWLI